MTIVQRVKNKKRPECDVLFEMVFDYSFGNIIFISKDYVHVHMLLCICLFQLPMSLLYLIVDICLCFEVSIFYNMYRDMVSPSLLGDEEKLIVTTQISY